MNTLSEETVNQHGYGADLAETLCALKSLVIWQ